MRAVYMQEPHNVSMIEMANPQPGAGDVLIRIHRVGLCGTDLQSYRGVDALTNFPLVPGHELGGEVVSCGQNVPKELYRKPCYGQALFQLRSLLSLPNPPHQLLRKQPNHGCTDARRRAV